VARGAGRQSGGLVGPATRGEALVFEQILDNIQKAAESAVTLQQEMIRQWAGGVPHLDGMAALSLRPPQEQAPPPVAEEARALQGQWAEAVTEQLRKHRKALDAQYEAGIRTIEDAFKVGQTKDPAEFCRLTEALFRQAFDSLRAVTESQVKELAAASRKFIEVLGKTAAGKA
jgi:hypothetical protein